MYDKNGLSLLCFCIFEADGFLSPQASVVSVPCGIARFTFSQRAKRHIFRYNANTMYGCDDNHRSISWKKVVVVRDCCYNELDQHDTTHPRCVFSIDVIPPTLTFPAPCTPRHCNVLNDHALAV